MAGYSGTPLAKKLGLRDGCRLALVRAPDGFADTLAPLPEGTRIVTRGAFDVAVAFCLKNAELADAITRAQGRMDADGGLWVAWPKKAAKVPTELTEDVVRAEALAAGLVDNKVCAIDETWSGLRLVLRVADRAKWRERLANPAR